jgi:hypothetical protein
VKKEMVFHVYTYAMGTLVQQSNGKFKKIRNGDLECLMTGHGYVLVEKSLVSFIQNLGVSGVEFLPAKICDENNSDNENYFQMFVSKEFDSGEVDSLPIEDEQFYLMDSKYLFATPSLVEKLKKSQIELEFSLGLSDFG